VTGHINKVDSQIASKRKFGKAEINGDSAPLLFRQTIRLDARQSAHKRSLPVIDVPGRADDD